MFVLAQNRSLSKRILFENPEEFLDFLFSKDNIFGFSQNWKIFYVNIKRSRNTDLGKIYLVHIVQTNHLNQLHESDFELIELKTLEKR